MEVREEEPFKNEDVCAICLAGYVEKCRTICNHFFCKRCIIRALYPEYTGTCPICRSAIDFQSVKIFDKNISIVKPKPLTIHGSIYIQGRLKGLASYHFDTEDDCYISYASPHCSMWPSLDNGDRPAVKKPFVNTSFDLSSRTFKGTIDWSPTTWGGDAIWIYEMIFTEDFNSIEDGSVNAYDKTGQQTECHKFGIDLNYQRLYDDHIFFE